MKDSQDIIMDITSIEDITKLKERKNIKYINLDIKNPNLEVIYYLLEHGQKYIYAEKIEDKKGYIYVSYEMFKEAELMMLDIINKISINLSELEIARYLYITIGKNIGYDINILPDKNEKFNLKNISTINNLWGSIYNKKGTNISFTKAYLYLCRLMNIDCTLTTTSNLGYQKNILNINHRKIIVDITQDIPYIQAGFQTKNFLGYNDNLELDKKIGYIKDNYNEKKIEEALKAVDYNEETIVSKILEKTSNILNVSAIRPAELSIIYNQIFNKYCPNYEISIHNLYMNNYPEREHFIAINYNNKYYSFNYVKNRFVEIKEKEIQESIEEEKVGVYLNERIPFIAKRITSTTLS